MTHDDEVAVILTKVVCDFYKQVNPSKKNIYRKKKN